MLNTSEKFQKALELHYAGSIDEAELLYEELLGEMPQDDLLLSYLSLIAIDKKDFDKAINYTNQAISINPDPKYYEDLANLYYDKKDFNKAIEAYLQVLTLDPNNHNILFNLGLSFLSEDRVDEAIDFFKKALSVNPDDAEIYYNLALAYVEKCEFKEAINSLNHSIKIKPDYPDANFLLGCIFLQTSNFEEGWKLYEWRFFKKDAIELLNFSKPRWDGSDIKDKTIYVYHEQGYGDSIMFARFLPLLSTISKKVLFKPQAGLEKLFKESNLPVDIIDNSVPSFNLEFDTYIHLLSLPGILKVNQYNIPFKNNYLKSNKEKTNQYKQEYFNNEQFKIGIAWQSNPNIEKKRPIPLKYFYKLAGLKNIKLYSLQKGYGIEQLDNIPEEVEIINIGKTFNNFSDTAAAIQNLDLVITIDTSIAHLSGSLGKSTLVLLPYSPDWRWLLDSENSIWYDSLKLYRQKTPGDWDETMKRILLDIKDILDS
ncbi:MAG: hypothetical protein A2255_00545 [Candidatus Melainabacteria bacterium RIFOXYA2_FULL_32_9]|nr:MAG: hypothetical protein A2255_00545 [Candidatus Melainabacteria bacterium RIFOXYA2_FULL_32_9]